MLEFWGILKDTARALQRDNALQLAAAVAFYSALSIGPILILTLRVVGHIWGADAVREEITQQIRTVMDGDSASTLVGVLRQADAGEGWDFAAWVGVATLLFSSMAVFAELQASMNKIWSAHSSQVSVVSFVKKRLLVLAMLLIVAAIVLVSLIFSWLTHRAEKMLLDGLHWSNTLWQALNLGITLFILTIVFASIFKILPDAKVAWREVWPGALATTVLFVAGKEVIGLVLGRNAVADLYGAAGSMVILLLWVYYSSVILFVGAEFTCVWAHHENPKRHRGRAVSKGDAKIKA